MDDLDVLGRDFGFGSRGKSNPMRSNSNSDRRSTNDDDPLFNNVFAAPNPTYKHSSMSHFDYDSIFNSENTNSHSKSTGGGGVSNNKPVYDEDIFDGLPGVVKNKSPKSNVRFDDDDVFVAVSSPRLSSKREQKSGFDDHFLGNNNKSTSFKTGKGFDDLLPGFGTGNRAKPESNHDSVPQAGPMHGNVLDDSFSAPNSAPDSSSSGVFTDPLDEISKLGKSRSARSDVAFENGATFDDLDSHAGYGKPSNPFSPSKSTAPQPGTKQKSNSSLRYSESSTQKQVPVNNSEEPPIFDKPNVPTDFGKSFAQTVPPQYYETGSHIDTPTSEEHEQQPEDIWLTVSEVPLFTPPTASPPPSRPPPPIPRQSSNEGSGSYYPSSRKTGDGTFSSSIYSEHSQSPKLARPVAKGPPVSQYDELDDFAMGNNAFSAAAASADAMKDAMDKAEAKFRHAKEVREREHAKAKLERDEQDEERLERERKQKADEEREKGRQAVGRATREARERAAIDARDRAAAETRLRSDRAAVDKANAEARARAERAAVQRAQVERAAVQRAQAEARERAASEAKERAEKAAAEARERTAAEARERTAAEAKEKALRDKAAVARAEAEARRRAERAAVDRAAAEARQRAAAQARERAEAAATKTSQQQKNDDDLENFFNMGRESSAPRSRENSNDSFFNQQSQNKGGPEAVKKASPAAGPSYNIKKSHSSTNVVDDLASIFGAPKGPSSGGFQEVDGETDERRRARLAVHQRTQQRAAQALAEKNNRDLQAQREQEERHRISDTLDIEIKRWAAGKEGNLRAMLSTLQYVLWPECGWQPVSLTDLITGASVRKVYRKATLCIHPDKVQQKGATLQQKYIAEKVFDLLKEAWNKLNSEELF